MTALLIKNALVVTLDDAGTILPQGEILVEGSKITAVGPSVKSRPARRSSTPKAASPCPA